MSLYSAEYHEQHVTGPVMNKLFEVYTSVMLKKKGFDPQPLAPPLKKSIKILKNHADYHDVCDRPMIVKLAPQPTSCLPNISSWPP